MVLAVFSCQYAPNVSQHLNVEERRLADRIDMPDLSQLVVERHTGKLDLVRWFDKYSGNVHTSHRSCRLRSPMSTEHDGIRLVWVQRQTV